MTSYYTPAELAERVQAIPTMNVITFDELQKSWNQPESYIGYLLVCQYEQDETAHTQLMNTVKDSVHWLPIETVSESSEDIYRFKLELKTTLPTKELEKFGL